MSDLDFTFEKKRFLRIAQAVEKADSPEHLRALLLADTSSPWHSYDMLWQLNHMEGIGNGLSELMSEGLDEQGAPL